MKRLDEIPVVENSGGDGQQNAEITAAKMEITTPSTSSHPMAGAFGSFVDDGSRHLGSVGASRLAAAYFTQLSGELHEAKSELKAANAARESAEKEVIALQTASKRQKVSDVTAAFLLILGPFLAAQGLEITSAKTEVTHAWLVGTGLLSIVIGLVVQLLPWKTH